MTLRVWPVIVGGFGLLQGLALSLVAAGYNTWQVQPWPLLRAINRPLVDMSAWLSEQTILDLQPDDIAIVFILLLTALGAAHALRTSGAENWDMHFQPESLGTWEPHAFRGGSLQAFVALIALILVFVALFSDTSTSVGNGEARESSLVPFMMICMLSQLFFAQWLTAGDAVTVVGLVMWAVFGL